MYGKVYLLVGHIDVDLLHLDALILAQRHLGLTVKKLQEKQLPELDEDFVGEVS